MNSLIRQVAGSAEDYEWYPTTKEIIAAMKADIDNDVEARFDFRSMLDCGAGDGRVLSSFDVERYAIEKSETLLNALPKDVFVVGTEFKEQVLIDKKVDIIFSNPPYSEYVEWATKIITEANAAFIYLVIPTRWENNDQIAQAIKIRDAHLKIIGTFDFLNADRQARATVHLLKISLIGKHRDRYYRQACDDPFDIWFDQHFSINADTADSGRLSGDRNRGASMRSKLNQMVCGDDLIKCLVNLYDDEMQALIETYKKLEGLDSVLLKELDVNIKGVCGALKLKITSLKDRYWKELFDNLDQVTSKLTYSSRDRMMRRLTANTNIDLTASNARALIIWMLKNANHYYDAQLIEVVERMTEAANVQMYKSNERVYRDCDWQYCRTPEDLSRYSLDYRVVLHRVGGMNQSTWDHELTKHNGLSEGAYTVLGDLCTIAGNLGYEPLDRPIDFEWEAGKNTEFMCKNLRTLHEETLFTAKAFKNGNLHIKLNQGFIRRLNVEFGRLKGWIGTPHEAAEELDMHIDDVAGAFGANLQIKNNDVLRLN